ncbi:PEPxxWA-CTERM sorting domain-containing protein [Sphingomonas profundi]|uniref:PEPxxWA-CTERM sorting domain-containing protein n=1 Tax=Alterirhizorhabdus profundi TaxID=2681549 RepID=UPI001E3F3CA1|nr:PEPxxWA-CTERM sorting domain-containing protein [Sphingomonas profundi]
MKHIVAFVAAMLLAGQAESAVVMRSFALTATRFANFFGETPPFGQLRVDFTVSYDDTGNGFVGAPDRFAAVTDGQLNAGAFSAAPAFGYFQPNAFSTFPRLVLGGALNGTNVLVNRTNDFFFSFDASATGPTPAMLSFTDADRSVAFLASDAVVSVAAVPETATWAMMLAGFGLIGAMLRRRPVRALA